MKLTQLSLSFLTYCLTIATGTIAQAASLSVIADGLDNARGLGFGDDGTIYVMEAGNGGNCQPSATLCAGNTGAVTKITPYGQQERIFLDLPSLAVSPSFNQSFVDGPQELKFDSSGNAYLLYAYGTFPGSRDAELNAAAGNTIPPDQVSNTPGLGQFYSIDLNTGNLTSIADLAKYELVNNPDRTDLVSNPYALVINGDTAYIADAGANAVLSVKLDGSNLQAIPLPKQTIENPELPPGFEQMPDKLEIQSVPTGVTVGSDGALYISEFTGFPSPEGKARIFRIGADGKPEVYLDGFTQISDLEFDKDGNLLVLQYADRSLWKGDLAGSLIQIAPDGTRTTLVAAKEGLEGATALGISPDNQIYVTNKGDRPQAGEVVRVNRTEAVSEPTSTLGMLAFSTLGAIMLWRRQKIVKPSNPLFSTFEPEVR